MLKILPHEATPEWLSSYNPGDEIPFSQLINNSVYYPACGFDGDIANLCMGYSHQFIYVDNLCLWREANREAIYQALNSPENFKGFNKIFQQEYEYCEILGRNTVTYEPILADDGKPDYGLNPHPFFAILTIFEPNPKQLAESTDSNTSTFNHIYERMSFLYICDDGCRTFEKLYQSHLAKPKAVAIIQPGEGFGGNWTNYYDEHKIFSRIIHKNPAGQPEIMIFGGIDSRGGRFRKQFWSDYSHNIYYSRLKNKGISI